MTITHGAASHGIEHFSLRRKSRWLLFFTPIFSAAQRTILATLAKGACLYLANRDTLSTSLIDVIRTMGVDALGITPSALALLPTEEVPACLKSITTVGEPMTQKMINTWADKVELRVSYGLSECTQLNFSRQVIKRDSPKIVGQPSDTTKAYILESSTTQVLDPGHAGELCLAGPQLAAGYHHRPTQTGASFIDNPFGDSKLYRTGDQAIRHRDGDFEIVGRIDQ